ncbi:MAG: tetratricopeptide repeat protein [Planctomycetes bacterium]|nr:tetratricopeptide repeat protein [Planctomycetota bacterium]
MSLFKRLFGGTGGFLGALKKNLRPAVSNLNPLIYRTIIREKTGKDAPALLSTDGTDFDLPRKLSVDELSTLARSVEAGQRGDQATSGGDLGEAAKHYREAFTLNPYNDLALMSYGVALAQLGDLRKGIRWVEKALRVNPGNERARNNLAAMKNEL